MIQINPDSDFKPSDEVLDYILENLCSIGLYANYTKKTIIIRSRRDHSEITRSDIPITMDGAKQIITLLKTEILLNGGF